MTQRSHKEYKSLREHDIPAYQEIPDTPDIIDNYSDAFAASSSAALRRSDISKLKLFFLGALLFLS